MGRDIEHPSSGYDSPLSVAVYIPNDGDANVRYYPLSTLRIGAGYFIPVFLCSSLHQRNVAGLRITLRPEPLINVAEWLCDLVTHHDMDMGERDSELHL